MVPVCNFRPGGRGDRQASRVPGSVRNHVSKIRWRVTETDRSVDVWFSHAQTQTQA